LQGSFCSSFLRLVSTFSLFSLSLLLELKKVADPYRWLEDPDAPETVEFVKQQNEVFFGLLSGSESREKVLFSPIFSFFPFCSVLLWASSSFTILALLSLGILVGLGGLVLCWEFRGRKRDPGSLLFL